MPRRPMDFYETSRSAVEALWEHYLDDNIHHKAQILEPCSGDWAITRTLWRLGYHNVWNNDLDTSKEAHTYLDARVHNFSGPEAAFTDVECVVTNPPFNQAFEILKNLHPQVGAIALLLRLTFLEPTKTRGPWLARNPPNKLIVLPRYSFTGDGKTDSVTCAWMIWDPTVKGVVIVPKKERQ